MDRRRDEELVTAARQGDLDAFAALVDRYRQPALRLAYGIAGDEAEDAVQDGFVKAFRSLGGFRTDAAFRPWRFTIVANEARNRRELRTGERYDTTDRDKLPPEDMEFQAGRNMAITGMANLAVKVRDLDAACAFYENAGAEVRDRMLWNNGERADVYLGPVMITLFTRAIYEADVELPAEGFLHPALFTDDLDAELRGHTVVWGPAVVEGTFGKRRIAFVEAPGGIRLEFMEQLEGPSAQTA